MSIVNQKLHKIATIYYRFKEIMITEQRTWNLWTTNLQVLLKLMKDILILEDLNYSEMISLDRMITLVLELPSDYK